MWGFFLRPCEGVRSTSGIDSDHLVRFRASGETRLPLPGTLVAFDGLAGVFV
jgi:hypothetical protein